MPDHVLVHDPLIEKLQEILHFYQLEQFDSWFETNGQKLVGVQQEGVYGGAGLLLMELALPFTTSLCAHDLHDAYREWLRIPNEETHAEVRRQGRRVYNAQHYNEQHESWSAHRAVHALSYVPKLKSYAVQRIMQTSHQIGCIHKGIDLKVNPELRNYLPIAGNSQLEGFLGKEFDKIESEEMQLKIYPYLLVMQQFEQI